MSVLKPTTFSIVAARKAASIYNPKLIIHKNPATSGFNFYILFNQVGGNLPTLSTGVTQRSKILPKDPTYAGNTKHIGFYQRENVIIFE